MTFDPTALNMPLDTSWNPGTGDPQMPVTGDKAIFGDLGNDYIVAGMGRVRVFGGWGFDLIDLRASTFEDNGLNDGPVPNLVPSGGGTFSLPTAANSVFGTPAWESLAYGGAGQDIYFAGTGGDRLIDWVGNHNSYYVPFSQFGMPAVSRTLMPFLPEFLYALSKSDGADQTLGIRADAFCASSAGGTNAACSDYPTYSGTAARNGEPFGEMGLVLQHDAAWHQQSGPPFNEMPENLGGVGIDVQKTANVRPFASSGTCDYLGASSACTAAANLSLPNGAGANLPSGTNTTGASAVPFTVTGAPGAQVTYTFREGANVVTGTGVIGPTGVFGTTVDLSGFPDGTITVTVTETGGGAANKTLTGSMGKNSIPPPVPTATAAAYANLYNLSVFNVTVTGQAGSIANVVITDGSTPIARVSNGMDFVGANGSVVIPVDVSALIDGLLTITVTLTNGAGDSSAYSFTVIKDTLLDPLSDTNAGQYVNRNNQGGYWFNAQGVAGDVVSYTFTDGKTTVTDTRILPSSGQWNANSINLSALKDGPITWTLTETKPSGNQTVIITTLTKLTVAPATPTVTLSPASDSGPSSSDYITSVTTPTFVVTQGATAAYTYVYVNGTRYTGQALATGTYTVTAISWDAAGNQSATGTAPKTLVIDTSAPTGSFTIAGKTVSGTTYTNNPSAALTLSFTGAPAGLYQMAFSVNGGAFGAPVAYAGTATVTLSGPDGLYTVSVRITDNAGNSATFSQQVYLTRVAPAISYTLTAPTNSGAYDLAKTITLTYAATATSGVASITATLDSKSWSSGTAINTETLAAGNHTLVITATDNAGNTSQTTVTITVHATIAGLLTATSDGSAAGSITSTSLLNTLKTDLSNAQAAFNANNLTLAQSYINKYLSDLKAGSKNVSAAYYALLSGWASDLSARL